MLFNATHGAEFLRVAVQLKHDPEFKGLLPNAPAMVVTLPKARSLQMFVGQLAETCQLCGFQCPRGS